MALLDRNNTKIQELEKVIEGHKNEVERIKWEQKRVMIEEEVKGREREMKEVRKKKIKHALKIHSEGRVFVEDCLRERGNAGEASHNISRDNVEVAGPNISVRKEVEKRETEAHNSSNDRITPREVLGTGSTDHLNLRGKEAETATLGEKRGLTEGMRMNKPKWIPYGNYNRLHPWWGQGSRWNRRNGGFRSWEERGRYWEGHEPERERHWEERERNQGWRWGSCNLRVTAIGTGKGEK